VEEIKWTLGRIIDFEYFLRKDMACSDEKDLQKRDREIYINSISPQERTSPGRMLLLLWLEAMRCSETISNSRDPESGAVKNSGSSGDRIKIASPGNMYEELLSLLRVIFMILGFMAGVSICLTFFSYTGHEPLNVSYFLALTLLPQICLIVIFSGFFLCLKFKLIKIRRFFLYHLLSLMIERSLLALNRDALHRLSADKRETLLAALAAVREGQQIYGLLFFWPLFILMQLFGIAFNLGILLSTLFRILFFDTAFGWQSTLQMSAQMVARVVSTVATPWGWFMGKGIGFPDLDQIIGSRIILKDGIYHLSTSNLVSWWPFICLAVIFYGFLPRVIMFFSGVILLKISLEQQSFDHRGCLRLLKRMVRPESAPEHSSPLAPVSRHPSSPDVDAVEKSTLLNHGAYAHSSPDPPPINMKPSIALVPDDINDLMDRDAFISLLRETHGLDIIKTVLIGVDFDKEIESIQEEYEAALKSRDLKVEDLALVLLQEAWQPPIRESINFIQSLREVTDKKTPIMVALTGEPGGDKLCSESPDREGKSVSDRYGASGAYHKSEKFFTPVERSDWDIWRVKLSTVADPWLTVERLV